MKVVYNGGLAYLYLYLTPGKIYEVITAPHDHFFAKYIIDDRGKVTNYSSNWFTPLNEIRQDKINQLIK
jgi:hypothetical protein